VKQNQHYLVRVLVAAMIDPLSVWINKGSNLGICSVWLSGASILSSSYLSPNQWQMSPVVMIIIMPLT